MKVRYLYSFPKLILLISLITASQVFTQHRDDYLTLEVPVTPEKLLPGIYENTANFAAVGDLMCHSTQFNYARVDADSFDFSGVYSGVKNFLSQPDFLFGNLETAFAGNKRAYSGYPVFNTPDDFLDGLKSAGFDYLFTANNHSVDMGLSGIKRTIQVMQERDFLYGGTSYTPEGKDSVKLINVNGIRTFVFAYTYGDNGMGNSETDLHLNKIDTVKIKRDISVADSSGADVVIVYLHFGVEYQREPNAYQKDIVEKCIAYGADIILASHPHVMQPVEYFKTNSRRLDTGFVAYSMGNFISNQRWRYSDAGVIINFSIAKNLISGKMRLAGLSFVPTWVYKGNTGKGREYIIFPAELSLKNEVPDYFSDTDIWYMKESFFDTYKIIREYDDKVKLSAIYDFTPAELDSIGKTVPRSNNK